MKTKRSQITIFITVGILILLFGVVYFYNLDDITKQEIKDEKLFGQQHQSNPVKSYVESCLNLIAKESVFLTGLQGGFYDTPKHSLNLGLYDIPYYFNGTLLMPAKKTIENEILKYFNYKLPYCINNFKAFREQGYDINADLSNSSLIIANSNVKINVHYPITFYRDGTYFQLNEFSNDIAIKLGIIYNLSAEIVNNLAKNGNICLSCLLDYGIKNNLSIEVYEISNSTFVFYLKDNQSIENGEPFTFRFAVQNKEQFKETDVLSGLNVIFIPDQLAEAGYPFTYKVIAENAKNVTFIDHTPLFDINNKTGVINFTPTLEQIGKHLIILDAYDNYGNKDTEIFRLNITFFNNPPVIDYIGFLKAQANKPFYYKVSASDIEYHNISYLDNADLFNISLSTGIINFTPKIKDIGSYKANITVIDSRGGKDIEELNLVVVGE